MSDMFEASLDGPLETIILVCECGEECVDQGQQQCIFCGSHEVRRESYNPYAEMEEVDDDFIQHEYEGEPWE